MNNIGVFTTDDLLYVTEVVIGGEKFVVQLDTGSSDLWVNATGRNIQFTNQTNVFAQGAYGKGEVEGTVQFAEVQIGNFILESQAFLYPSNITDFDLTKYDGIMGMAFDTGFIFPALEAAWGNQAADKLGSSPITSLFAMNATLPNSFDVALGREDGVSKVASGDFFIGQHAPDAGALMSAPKLSSLNVDHWTILLDGLTVNNKPFSFSKSSVQGVAAGKAVAVLDTGFSLPQIPKDMLDAMYQGVPGSLFSEDDLTYLVPCDAGANVTFIFGGQNIPLHPLDLAIPFAITLPSGENRTVCVGAYQINSLDPNKGFSGFDMILGDGFLRSVYASFDYGDYHPGDENVTGQAPFVQLLPTTNPATMWQEFNQTRTAQLADMPPPITPTDLATAVNATSSAAPSDNNLSASGAVAEDDASSGSSGDSWGKKYGTIALALLGANLLVGILVFAVVLTLCVRGVKGRDRAGRYAPVRFKTMQADSDPEREGIRYSD